MSPELKPEVIEEDGGDDPHSFAFIPQQIEADWHEKWGPLLEGKETRPSSPMPSRSSGRAHSNARCRSFPETPR